MRKVNHRLVDIYDMASTVIPPDNVQETGAEVILLIDNKIDEMLVLEPLIPG